MVLVVLAVAWGSILVFWLRSRREGSEFGDSVGLFHRHLHVLERTAPVSLAPANRLRSPAVSPLSGRSAPSLAMTRIAPISPRAGHNLAVARRRSLRRRRRDVLFVLAVLVVATLILALGTGSHALVLVQLVSDAGLAGYVSLLVRLRNLAAERDMKLHVLTPPARSIGYGRPAGYETHGGYAAPVGYAMPAGYGELTLRQVAN